MKTKNPTEHYQKLDKMCDNIDTAISSLNKYEHFKGNTLLNEAWHFIQDIKETEYWRLHKQGELIDPPTEDLNK